MKTILTLALLLSGTAALAQGTVDDYRRSSAIRSKYSNKMINGDVSVHRMRDGHKFWYSVFNGDSTVYKEVDADKNTVTMLPGNPETQRPRRWQGMGGRPRHWAEVPDEKDGMRRSPSDSTLFVFHRDNNLWIRQGGTEKALTTNGDSTNYYSAWGSFSSDGLYYATVRIKPAPKHYYYFVESMPSPSRSPFGGMNRGTSSLRGVQPVLHQMEYAKPGDSLNYRVPVVIEMATGRVIEPSTELFKSQYEVSAPRWDNPSTPALNSKPSTLNSHTLTFTFNERGHHTYRLLELNAETGDVRTLIEEKNDKYVNYNRLYRHDFEDGRRILWTSERDGRNHIYLYDRQKAQLIRQV